MTRDHHSGNDPVYEPESPDDLERFDEIERSLKKARPRPPCLDVDAVLQIASQVDADSRIGLPATSAAGRSSYDVASVPGRPWFNRVGTVMAGSWSCGAIVGALVMFAAMNGMSRPLTRPANTVKSEQRVPRPSSSETRLTGGATHGSLPDSLASSFGADRVDSLNIDTFAVAMFLDSLESSDSVYFRDSTLRAGMHLNPVVGNTSSVLPAKRPAQIGDLEQPRHFEKERPPETDTSPANARGQLLQDLLIEMRG